jgi:hypothetical protein
MSIETANYISQFNSAIPADTDPVSETSAILRQVKTVLQNQFPNLGTTPVTSTATQLNTGVLPVGAIIAFSGGTVPTGYALCNGQTVARSDGSGSITTPNLMDRFIIGAGNVYALSSLGGAPFATPTISIGGTALSVANLPSGPLVTLHDPGHAHSINDPGHSHVYNKPVSLGVYQPSTFQAVSNYDVNGITSAATTGITINASATGLTVTSNGTDTPHAHAASSSTISTVPPYVALYYIMKI